mgnify:CR=1 FL=1
MTDIAKYILCLFAAVLLLSCAGKDRYVTLTGFAQGGTYTVKFNMKDVDVRVEEIRDSVDAILADIDNSLSGYNRNSLVSRFNEGDTIVPDNLFLDIYGHAYEIYRETGGIVDVASGPLFDLWGFGFKNGSMPSDEKVSHVMKGCGMNRMFPDMSAVVRPDGTLDGLSMLLCEKGRFTAVPPLPQLNYNAIAQGYSCDVIAAYLYSIGVKDMMVDIGEIYCDGKNPSGKQWTIGIDKPVDGNDQPGTQIQAVFSIPEGPHGVVTSGNYRKFYIKDGRKYAHTIDPRPGYPVSHTLLSATIIAPDAMTADAYATYCMVVGLEESKTFLEAAADLASRPDLSGYLVYDDAGVFATWASENFPPVSTL